MATKTSQKISWLHGPKTTALLLRIGLAVTFGYAAIDGWREPAAWIGYIPSFVSHFIVLTAFLKVFEVIELVLALWLLTGRYVKYAAALAAAMLAGIVLANPHALLITFRDIAIFFMALGLLCL